MVMQVGTSFGPTEDVTLPNQTQNSSNPQNQSTQSNSRRRRPRRTPNNQYGVQAASQDPTTLNTSTHSPSQQMIEHDNPRSQDRGGGGGRGRGGIALRPASVAPPSEPHDQRSTAQNSSAKLARARRGNTGSSRGSTHQSTVIGQRQFGGSLTNTTTTSSALQGGASEFKPGQQHNVQHPSINATKSKRDGRQGPQHRARRPSKSTAPDLASRLHEDIDLGRYECAICTSEVTRRSRVWSCHTCWTVFHLDCIKKWSSNSEAALAQQNSDGQTATPIKWRCPGCNLPQDEKPRSYNCWCGKDHEPRSITGLPPHSCGQTCGKSRLLPRKCPHPCELLCHAGPCPPCAHMGPTGRCFCGKESSTRRCVDTNYESGWSCGKVCGDVMPCEEHSCLRECHEGLCGACEIRIDGRCYCGRDEKPVMCCDKDDEKHTKRTHLDQDGRRLTEDWIGIFICSQLCERPFDCGKHTCPKPCHTSEQAVVHCPRSPDVVDRCPCGKTSLADISDKTRTSCEDPIPNCTKSCSKPLVCGHECQQECHIGECMPCLRRVHIECRCGRTSATTICHQGSNDPPQCRRICHVALNCGRHECGERCCAGEKKAAQRNTNKRKQRPLNAPRVVDDGFEAEHICTRQCGRSLKCGNHGCEELCHRGQCGSCREAIFDEISCHCGRTTLQPPLPCGTKSPPCRHPCERVKGCGHPQVQHNCHQDDEECPKCPFLMEKDCLCGKRTLKNQKCYFTEVRCGEICRRQLKCGSHTCQKTCHRPGECEDSNGPCAQPCGKPKRACNHPCEDKCHAPYPCKEDKPCPHKTLITCPCQHLKQEMRCNASSTSDGNSTKQLTCNEECARLARNHKLALALDIDPETHTDDHIPYASETLSLFQSLGQKWSTDQEREFRVFASDESEKRLRFNPMAASQRAFLHHLAEDFGLDSESMDPEPHRHVAIFKTPRFVSAPDKTIRDCVRIQRSQASVAAQQHINQQQQSRAQKSNESQSWNGLLLTNVRFALTTDEIENETRAVLGPDSASKVDFTVQFLPDGNVALKARKARQPSQQPSPVGSDIEDSATPASRALHTTLASLKAPLFRAFAAHSFGYLQLARFDASLNTLRRESDSVAGGGWSQVAAKAAAPRRSMPQPQSNQTMGGFTVLGTFSKKKPEKKKPKSKVDPNEVVEDWTDAVDAQEAEDRGGQDQEARQDDVSGEVGNMHDPAPHVSDLDEASTEVLGNDDIDDTAVNDTAKGNDSTMEVQNIITHVRKEVTASTEEASEKQKSNDDKAAPDNVD